MNSLPAWDNSTEYKSIFSQDFERDFNEVQVLLSKIERLNVDLSASSLADQIAALQDISKCKLEAVTLISNLSSYVNCERTLDTSNEMAQKAKAKVEELSARSSVAGIPCAIYLRQCDDSTLQAYLDTELTSQETFYWNNQRKMKLHDLAPSEERTLAQFQRFGRDHWGDLYTAIAGTLKVAVPSKDHLVGVAEAAGLLRSPDPVLRREAWHGLQKAWKSVEIPCSAVLNNIVGFRLEEYAKRSQVKKLHFLDTPLFESRIEAKTLEAMMGAVHECNSIPRRALKGMIDVLSKERNESLKPLGGDDLSISKGGKISGKLDPWDLMAPAPKGSDFSISFSEALTMIGDSFANVDPKMGDFVQMMSKNQWIEARVLPNKAPGAYCTGFLKSKTPRVFQSYMGSMKDVSTLAHELGHAYHSWVLRDFPLMQTHYPMTLAETASIFSETLLSERLMATGNASGKFSVAWEEASNAVSLLMNIPARFEFEKELYQARLEGPLSAAELGRLTDQAWKKWYGDLLTQTESQYWMTKLHFSISGVSFYNFPYTFGYLFGLGIYAQREKLGKDFHQAYVAILQDTGRMTAEDLIQKHLRMDIRQPGFWFESLKIVERKISYFETLI